MEVLSLAHRYVFSELTTSISEYLEAVLNNRNVCLIYDLASAYGLESLCQTCCEYMDRNAGEIIHTDAFLSLSSVSYSFMVFLVI